MATVYRNLKSMTEEGLLRVVDLPGESPLYEPAAQAHHHHFQCKVQCKVCHRVFDILGCPGVLKNLALRGFFR